MSKKGLFILSFIFLLMGCSGSNRLGPEPKSALKEYINRSFNLSGIEGRRALEELLTGKAKIRLASWSDEQFRSAFLNQKRKFKNLAIKEEKEISSNEVNLTYELTYIDGEKGVDTKVTTRKLAYLIKEGDRWRIGEVRNIKELIEYQNEMSLP